MIYISMIDNFMSGWGMAEGKKNVLIFECGDSQEAIKVMNYGQTREEMSDAFVSPRKPEFNSDMFYSQVKNKENFPIAYK